MSFRNFSRKADGKEPLPEYERDYYDDACSIMGNTFLLDDSRKVSAEIWAESGYSFLTYRFDNAGIEDHSIEEMIEYLNNNGMKIDKEKHGQKIDLIETGGEYRLTLTVGTQED